MPDYAHSLRSAYMHNAVPPLTGLQKRTIKAIYHRAKWHERIRCPMCGRLIPQGKRHVDHMIPLSRGGLHVPENLEIMCKKCNLKKGAMRTDEIFHTYKGGEHELWPPEHRAVMEEYYLGAGRGQTEWESLRRMWNYPCVEVDIPTWEYKKMRDSMEERGISNDATYLLILMREDIGQIEPHELEHDQ